MWIALQDRIHAVTECVRRAGLPLGCSTSKPRNVDDYPFTDNPAEYKIYWDVRKGLIPIVGAAREPGAPLRKGWEITVVWVDTLIRKFQ